MLDTRYTKVLNVSFPSFEELLTNSEQKIPQNSADTDSLQRNLDCAVINWTLKGMEGKEAANFQSVRGVFQESGQVYEGSAIHSKSHIQIAIRDPACIMGYFIPN